MADDEFLEEALPHLDMLYNLARRLTATREDAEDLVQETYAKALEGYRRRRPQRMTAWLATICLNGARSRHRRRATRPAELLEAEPGIDIPSTSDTAGQAIAATDADAVHEAMARLPHEQREAITLMDLCGFTAAQAGDVLHVSRNTVLSRVHRGHKRLAVLLEEVTRLDP
ncbi:MAG TPA: RNA polymerase sigma factor, partial [Actinomycetota bacterium]|nr:RNA polymerase sigma factor [Actinomycetota bacterium]